jgi:hypothetical protein
LLHSSTDSHTRSDVDVGVLASNSLEASQNLCAWHVLLPGTLMYVDVGHAAHSRSAVSVGARDSNVPAAQTVVAEHDRSDVSVAAAASNSSSVQTDNDAQNLSVDGVGAPISNSSPSEQTRIVSHSRSASKNTVASVL